MTANDCMDACALTRLEPSRSVCAPQTVSEKKQTDVSASAAAVAFANLLSLASNQLNAMTLKTEETRAKSKQVCAATPCRCKLDVANWV